MQQMDKNMLRGVKAMLDAGFKDLECTVWAQGQPVNCWIVGASHGQLSVERMDNGQEYSNIPLANVQIEDELAETMRAYFERVMENRTVRPFGQGAQSRAGTYSAGKLGFRAR